MDVRRPEFLMSPGPTEVPPKVLAATAQPTLYHRGPRFAAMLSESVAALKRILFTSGDVFVMAGSGTLAMEAAIANTLSAGDKVIVVETGTFGARNTKICKAFGVEVVRIAYEGGNVAKPEDVDLALAADPSIKAVLIQHSETSTGVVNDVEAIGKVVRAHDKLFVVDTISGAGAAPLRIDAWNVDVACGASQKALMCPPGLAFITVGPRAWAAYETSTLPRFYTDFKHHKDTVDKGETPFTPAVNLVCGLREALRILEAEGIEQCWERHRVLGAACRAGAQALGLDLFGEKPERGSVLTPVLMADGVGAKKLIKLVREKHGIVLTGGKGDLADKIFRIGHCGYYSPSDILRVWAVLEVALPAVGFPVKAGAAVEAAGAVLREAGMA